MKEYKNIRLESEVVYQQNEDGMMLYVPDEGMIHAVNVTAGDIVLLIEQGKDSLELLVNEFMLKYVDVTADKLEDDIKEILSLLEKLKIIKEE